MTDIIIAYTDGACKGNGAQGGGAGGFGVYLCYPDGSERHIWGGETDSTNNRMELTAAITALRHTPTDIPLQLWTDSAYVKNGITSWLQGWKAKNWRKADGKPVLNQALWQELDVLAGGRDIDWRWVKGHAGIHGNEIADHLANQGVSGQGDQWINQAHSAQEYDRLMPNPTLISAQTTTMPPTDQTTPLKTDDFLWTTGEQNPQYDGDTHRHNPDFWAILPEPINRGRPERQLIMDTETTGMDETGGDRLLEIGMLEMVGRRLTGQKLHVYLNPERHIDAEVIRVHGITNEFVADKPKFSQVADKVFEFIKGAELIAHNASFDMKFLTMEFERLGIRDLDQHVTVIDSLAIARELYKGQRNSLDALVKRLGVGKKDRTYHGALLDSEILAEVYLTMTGGQVALDIGQEQQGSEKHESHANLSHLANSLAHSVADMDSDHAWRQANIQG